jgi:hypothetical protein
MQGRDFLSLAKELVVGKTEVHWRGAIVHAYYALFLESRDALIRWGRPAAPRQNIHAQVRLKFTYANDIELRAIGDALDELVRLRNRASYDLQHLADFTSSTVADTAIQRATTALTMLDGIDTDSIRRNAAIAAIKQ